MPAPVSINLEYVRLCSCAGLEVLVPLGLPEVTWVNTHGGALAQALSQACQQHWLCYGENLDVLRLLCFGNLGDADVQTVTLSVSVAASKDQYLYAQHQRRFALFYRQLNDKQLLGWIPALGIEVTAVTLDELLQNAQANVQLEFVRKGRLNNVRALIEADWFSQAEWHQQPLALKFYRPGEWQAAIHNNTEALLPTVASALSPAPDDVVGLDDELRQLSDSLAEPLAQSTLLVGAPGSGKTTLLNGYVKQRRRQRRKPLWETSAGRMIQALVGDAGWQKNLALLCRELRDGREILYVNHLLELFEVGQYIGNSVSIGEALREPLARGELILIGEATDEELAQLDVRSPGFSALFQHVRIVSQSDEALTTTINQAVAAIARRHKVTVSDAAIAEILRLQRRYLPYSGFPGKPIRFLEAMILRAKNQTGVQPIPVLGRAQACAAFCLESAMPPALIDDAVAFDRDVARSFFQRRLFGQNHAIDAVLDVLTALKAGLLRSNKPIANLLFIGPTGVGKTELAKILAEYVFGDNRKVLRLDMSEYSDPQGVLRLSGDLHDNNGGSLVSQIRQQPFSVVLFDELEKAHPNFFDLLLQILGEGRLTDGRGQVANFCSAIIVMTSNIGAEGFQRPHIGFNKTFDYTHSGQHFEQAVQDYFRPELFNRLDRIIAFHPLHADLQPRVIARQIDLLRRRAGLSERPIDLEIDDEALVWLSQQGHDPRYGARQMQRTLRRHLINPLARYLNAQPASRPRAVRVIPNAQATVLQITDSSSAALTVSESTARLHDHAEACADLRRQLQAVEEGPVYLTLLNERDRLTKLRKNNKKYEKRYTTEMQRMRELNQVLAAMDALHRELLEQETAALVALIDQVDSDAEFMVEHLIERYHALQLELLLLAQPTLQYATLGLYGAEPHLPPLLAFYQSLCSTHGIEVVTHVVRLIGDTYQSSRYPLPNSAKQQRHRIIGYELALKGCCPLLFLGSETGVLRWQTQQRNFDYYVTVSANLIKEFGASMDVKEFQTPADVHRQTFFEQLKPQRSIRDGQLKDQRFKIEDQFPAAPLLRQHLIERERAQMTALLLGESLPT